MVDFACADPIRPNDAGLKGDSVCVDLVLRPKCVLNARDGTTFWYSIVF
jgi:hypothetical protein